MFTSNQEASKEDIMSEDQRDQHGKGWNHDEYDSKSYILGLRTFLQFIHSKIELNLYYILIIFKSVFIIKHFDIKLQRIKLYHNIVIVIITA